MATAMNLRRKWAEGKAAFGAFAVIPSAFSVELICVPDLDYVCIDQQHGLIDYAGMLDMMRAAELHGVVTFTRVPANEGWMIGKALDAGIQGVIVPMVNNRIEAARAVAACRYGPGTTRSYGPLRASMVMGSRDTSIVGNQVLCFAMVETREGVANIEEIASTPGLDGIYIGPADLALGLGLPPDLDKKEPEHIAAVQTILTMCQKYKIVPGIQCGSGIAARQQVESGFRMVTYFKDSAALPVAAKRELAAARDTGVANESDGYV